MAAVRPPVAPPVIAAPADRPPARGEVPERGPEHRVLAVEGEPRVLIQRVLGGSEDAVGAVDARSPPPDLVPILLLAPIGPRSGSDGLLDLQPQDHLLQSGEGFLRRGGGAVGGGAALVEGGGGALAVAEVLDALPHESDRMAEKRTGVM